MGLSIAKVSPGRQRYFLEVVATEDTELAGAEAPGSWRGAAPAALGLRGEVEATHLDAVLGGVDPRSGEVLRSRPVRVAGFDLTFAAPKSASVLFGLASEDVASEVRDSHESAVGAALGFLERDALRARRGSGPARRQVSVSGAIAAEFLHRTSRASDPHLHSHVLVANLVRDREGRWSALDARGLFWLARTAGFLYEAHVRHEMTARLGVSWGEVRNGRSDIEGFHPAALRAFSRRAQQVEEMLARWGTDSGRAGDLAALSTRGPKDTSVSFDSLRSEWCERASRVGLQRSAIYRSLGRSHGPSAAPFEQVAREIAERVLGPSGVTATHATFSRFDVIRECCEVLSRGAAVEEVEAVADAVLSSPLARQVAVPRSRAGPDAAGAVEERSSPALWGEASRPWSTTELAAIESRISSAFESRREEEIAVVRAPLEQFAGSVGIDASQRDAVAHIVGSGAGLEVVSGSSRGGALDALDLARAVWESAGFHVIGAARSERVVAELDSMVGIASTTVGALLEEMELPGGGLPERSVLVVAEASDVPLRHLDAVLERAGAAEAKVVLVGEPPTHGRGGHRCGGPLLEALAAETRSVCLDGGLRGLGWALEDGDRASDLGARSVTRARGAAEVVMGSCLATVRECLLGDWWAAWQAGEVVEMVATRARELDALNARARDILDRAGCLGEGVKVAGRELRIGDRVRFSEGRRRSSSGLPAGGTISGISDDESSVRLTPLDGPEVSLGVAELARCRLSFAYAVGAWEKGLVPGARALLLGDDRLRAATGWRLMSADDTHYVVRGAVHDLPTAGMQTGKWPLALHSTAAEASPARDREVLGERESAHARSVLGHAACVSPPAHIAREMGTPPDGLARRARWRELAGAVQAYRQRWEINDDRRSVGEVHESVLQRVERAEIDRALRLAARELGPSAELGRVVRREQELGQERYLSAAI